MYMDRISMISMISVIIRQIGRISVKIRQISKISAAFHGRLTRLPWPANVATMDGGHPMGCYCAAARLEETE